MVTEQWVTVYSPASVGLAVMVSNRGGVKFILSDNNTVCKLSMEQAMIMFQELGKAFGAENITGKDDDHG